jgi:hypothetical protein
MIASCFLFCSGINNPKVPLQATWLNLTEQSNLRNEGKIITI